MRNIFYLSIIILALIFSSCSKNNLNSGSSNLSPVEFSDKIKELPDAPVIDVRTPEEFSKGHLENAKNIVLTGNDFEKQISVFDKSKPVFIYCLSGNRSASAASIMRSGGFKEVYELSGGIMKWGRANLPVTRENIHTANISSGMTRKQFDDKLVTDKLVLASGDTPRSSRRAPRKRRVLGCPARLGCSRAAHRVDADRRALPPRCRPGPTAPVAAAAVHGRGERSAAPRRRCLRCRAGGPR